MPFSFPRKWSSASFAGHGTWALGAPEIVLPSWQGANLAHATELAATGQRVLALAHSQAALDSERLPGDLQAVAFVLPAERLRDDASEAIAYFAA